MSASNTGDDVGTKLQFHPDENERPARYQKPRLPREDYLGRRTYHITLPTAARTPVFEDIDIGRRFEATLLDCAAKLDFSLLAYCFMPDHLHVLLRGQAVSSDLLRFVQRYKQQTGYYFKSISGDRPWQQSFFDRVLRQEESPGGVAAYIFDNPVAEGLTEAHPAFLLRGGELWPSFKQAAPAAPRSARLDGGDVGTKLQLRPLHSPDGAEASSLHLDSRGSSPRWDESHIQTRKARLESNGELR